MLWLSLELWKSSDKDLFGIMIILVMLIGTGTIIYILIWFKDDPNSSKSRSRMDKISGGWCRFDSRFFVWDYWNINVN